MAARSTSRRWIGRSAWAVAALLSVAIALFSYRFLIDVGPRSPQILGNLFAKPWLDLHIAGAATALLIGAFQFRPARLRRGKAHRYLGRVYAVGCLLGSIGGLVLAFGSYAGPIATVGFGSLAIIWFATTLLGWRTALQLRFVEHRRWMIRSWALTLAAVTLRLYLPMWPMLHIDPLEGYRATSFLAWVPNLLIAELYLRRQARATPATSMAHARTPLIQAATT